MTYVQSKYWEPVKLAVVKQFVSKTPYKMQLSIIRQACDLLQKINNNSGASGKMAVTVNTLLKDTQDRRPNKMVTCLGIVCTISFERPVNYLCDAWHVFPPKYEAWTHFNN